MSWVDQDPLDAKFLDAALRGDAPGALEALRLGASREARALGMANAGALALAVLPGRDQAGRLTHKDIVGIVAALIEAGCDPRARNRFGEEPLHRAALMGAPTEAIEALVEAGASASAIDSQGCGPLWFAALGEKQEAARVLIELGADPWALNGARAGPISKESMRREYPWLLDIIPSALAARERRAIASALAPARPSQPGRKARP